MDPTLANTLLLLGLGAFAYLLGGIPNAVIIGLLFYKKNPLEYGSHNSGGTNAGRVLGAKAGVAVIVLDILKAAAVFWISWAILYLSPLQESLTLWDAGRIHLWITLPLESLGHCFSPYLKGKGGKAVASLYGSIGGTSWVMFPLCFLLFFLFFRLTKKVMSKASLLTGLALVVLEWGLVAGNYLAGPSYYGIASWTFELAPGGELLWEAGVAVTLVYIVLVIRHRDNIRRIHDGEEKSLTWQK